VPPPIYLDHNATTPLLPEVVDAMIPYLREHFGNPSSSHVYGQAAKRAVEEARQEVAALIGASPEADEIVFTSGGTEANNLAIRGVAAARSELRHIVTTTIEHPATTNPCAWLARDGYRVTQLPVDPDGCVRVPDVIEEGTALVTIMHSNNETGVLQPVVELATRARAAGALVHSDAAQSIGKVPVHVGDVDLLSIAGHKLYAPKGVGALYVRRGTPIAPFVLGAGHERGLRPGTENVASIVGLGVACAAAKRDLRVVGAAMRGRTTRLFELLSAAIPGLAINGTAERLPNTLNVRFPRVSGTALLAAAPEVAASTGSACHDGHETASAVILAMGMTPEEAAGSVRLTLGRSTTDVEVIEAAEALIRAWRQLTV
jgi:cysteine desulfurase